MERMKKSRVFGFFALVVCIIAGRGSHYYPILFPIGIAVWGVLVATTLYFYRKGM
jgi:hypothetical protein